MLGRNKNHIQNKDITNIKKEVQNYEMAFESFDFGPEANSACVCTRNLIPTGYPTQSHMHTHRLHTNTSHTEH